MFRLRRIASVQNVESLREMGIELPPEVIRQINLDGCIMHLPYGGKMEIGIPGLVAVDRGFGPAKGEKHQGLDAFLMRKAIEAGAGFEVDEVTKIDLGINGKAIVATKKGRYSAGFVMGAFGHNRSLHQAISVPSGYQLDYPQTRVSSVHEFVINDEKFYKKNYASKFHLVVVPMNLKDQNVLFAAFIPKGDRRVSMVLMGKENVTSHDIDSFMESKYVHGLLPDSMLGENKLWKTMVDAGGCCQCLCLRNTITTQSPENFAVAIPGGIFQIGDVGPTNLYKDGIGAAVLTAKLGSDAYLARDLDAFTSQANTRFPHDDDHFAALLMEANDFAVRHPLSERGLVYLHQHNVPIFSRLANDYTRHMITADIPYSQMLPQVVRRALEVAFHK